MVKALIIDFDGTIVTEDIMDLLCGLAGKKADSERLNQLFHEGKLNGLTGLIQRINFLTGLSLKQIQTVVDENDYLRDGATELFDYLKANNIVTIIASGSIVPLLEIYRHKLRADYVVGSRPRIIDGRIGVITEEDYSGMDFKVRDSRAILDNLGITYDSVIAVGDSPADKGIFDLAAKSIAVDPKSGIEKCADFVIDNDLRDIIPILSQRLTE